MFLCLCQAPTESYADIGGLQKQIQEVKEAVELPMTHPELYEDIGIKPPKGVIFFGPPGTGQTKRNTDERRARREGRSGLVRSRLRLLCC